MAAVERGLDSWFSATLDFLLSVLGFTLVWYPMVSLGNTILGSPLSPSASNLILGVLVLGGSYPVVTGHWSLGKVGEYVFVLITSAIGWGLIGMIIVIAFGVSISGSNLAPQAIVWTTAYLTAYIVVYRVELSIFS